MADSLQLRSTYNLSTLAPTILGATLKNVKLTSIVDYDVAIRQDTVDRKFKAIYAVLDVKPVNDPTICTYYVFKTEQGTSVILADVWIDMNSVTLVTSQNFRISVTGTSSADINRLKAAMVALGFTSFNIEEVS